MDKDEEIKGQSVRIPVKWLPSDSLPSLSVHSLFITHGLGDEFYLVFGEYDIPIDASSLEGPPELVLIRPVAKFSITPSAMLDIASAINRNVQKYIDAKSSGVVEVKNEDGCS